MSGLGHTLDGTEVGRLGLGCFFYGSSAREDSVRTIRGALELGVNLLDTSDAYAAGENEVLVGEAIAGRRQQAFIITKFGWVLDSSGNPIRLDGSSAHVRRSCEASLKRLGTDYVDLYIAHRIDPSVPIEETAGELSRLMEEGKIRAMGLSEAGVATVERAHRASSLGALQTEYSLWSREPEAELIPLCRRVGVAFIAYSPLGRGFLTGRILDESDLEAGDFRRDHPRFQAENLSHNLPLVSSLRELGAELGHTPAQLALAWLLSRPGRVYAIPGTRRLEHLRENLDALKVRLTAAELDAVGSAVPPGQVHGQRHPAGHMKTIGR
jgi:aryl-alcohol dehydrogenase-like predicted oxidoreductase